MSDIELEFKKINGKKISAEIGQKLFAEIDNLNLPQKPSLGILCVGNDLASLTFINVKKKFGEKYGFVVNLEKLDFDNQKIISNEDLVKFKDEIKNKLIELQTNNNAVILQLPLPENLKEFTSEILSVIEKEKDVDNLNDGNFEAPIVLALQKSLNITNENWFTKKFAIVGLGQVVGLPIKNFLDNNNIENIVIQRQDHEKIKEADIVISGVGLPHLIKKEFIKENSILIDYGCSYVDGIAYGDFDITCYENAKFYTPVPGCMGPLVVASLFENVLKTVNHV